jgi:hypothetical protein
VLFDIDGLTNVKDPGFLSCINFFAKPSDMQTDASLRDYFDFFLIVSIAGRCK